MNDEIVDDELSQMYEEDTRARKVLDARTFDKPIKYLRVKRPVSLSPEATVAEAVTLMREKKIGCVLVTQGEKLAGIFTERDVLMKAAGEENYRALKLADVMTRGVKSFEESDSIAFVLNAMRVGGYRHVPVVDEDNKPIAVISVKDIIAFILDHFAEDILNLPPSPIRKTEQREGA